jgi:mannose-6-phosphate isomerase-like protein (cupin superfamily)
MMQPDRTPPMQPEDLAQKLRQVTTHSDPHVVADYNDNDVMVVRFKGAFPFHLHETTDDFFLVLEGEIQMDTEGTSHLVRAEELFIVPKGVTHRPRTDAECKVLMIEPKGEPNTGDPATAAAKPRI